MSEEKKTEVTEEVKEARKLSMEELEEVSGGQIDESVILAQLAEKAEEQVVAIAGKAIKEASPATIITGYIAKADIITAEIEP